ncbi:MAG: SAM-dependent methyltransferase [Paracoccaceae bacterium]
MTVTELGFVERYDEVIAHPSTRKLYCDTGYYNVGYWSKGAKTTAEASAELLDQHLSRAGPFNEGSRIVDLGCGLGDTTARTAAAAPKSDVIGVNISDAQIATARAAHPDVRFEVMDGTRLNFEENSIDRLISVEAVFHFDTRLQFLQSLRPLMAKGGKVVLTDVLFAEGSDPWDWWVPAANRGLGLSGYEPLCESTGFEVQSIEDITHATWAPFCNALRKNGSAEAADRIENWVSHYLMVVLTLG